MPASPPRERAPVPCAIVSRTAVGRTTRLKENCHVSLDPARLRSHSPSRCPRNGGGGASTSTPPPRTSLSRCRASGPPRRRRSSTTAPPRRLQVGRGAEGRQRHRRQAIREAQGASSRSARRRRLSPPPARPTPGAITRLTPGRSRRPDRRRPRARSSRWRTPRARNSGNGRDIEQVVNPGNVRRVVAGIRLPLKGTGAGAAFRT